MERANDDKTSAVHFLRFELPPLAIAALHAGTGVSAGVGHPQLTVHIKAIPYGGDVGPRVSTNFRTFYQRYGQAGNKIRFQGPRGVSFKPIQEGEQSSQH